MDTVTGYIKKFMSEAKEYKHPFAAEFDKIRDLIDPEDGSEFEIHIKNKDEIPTSINPETGWLEVLDVDEDADGLLSIEKENGVWSWQTIIKTDRADYDDKETGFSSLEECLDSLFNYASYFDSFEVLGIA